MAKEAEQLVLCFGDSLTEGWYAYGSKRHAYALRLEKLLAAHGAFACVELGLAGECTPDMLVRLRDLHKACPTRFRFAVLLGGTNDLGSPNADPARIAGNLASMCDVAHEGFGAERVFVMTIPETMYDHDRDDELLRGATATNALLEALPADRPFVEVVPLRRKMPYEGLAEAERKLLWDDGLHWTAAGSDRVGEIVFESLGPHAAK